MGLLLNMLGAKVTGASLPAVGLQNLYSLISARTAHRGSHKLFSCTHSFCEIFCIAKFFTALDILFRDLAGLVATARECGDDGSPGPGPASQFFEPGPGVGTASAL
mgnify:CR=1 FL=1